MMKRILVATDGSANARKAMQAAAELAGRVNPEQVTVIHVMMDPRSLMAIDLDAAYWNQLHETMETEGERILEEAHELLSEHWDGQVEKVLTLGSPAAEIRRQVELRQIDLLVVGSRGLGALESMLMGSVSGRLVQRPPCSVLIVKDD